MVTLASFVLLFQRFVVGKKLDSVRSKVIVYSKVVAVVVVVVVVATFDHFSHPDGQLSYHTVDERKGSGVEFKTLGRRVDSFRLIEFLSKLLCL